MKKFVFTFLLVTVFLSGCIFKKAEPDTTAAELETTPPLVIPIATYTPSVMTEKYKGMEPLACEGRTDIQDCYANVAILKNDPSLCLKMEPGLDDLCLQNYYLQKNDKNVCKTLPKKGIQKTCEKYYKNLK